MDWLAERGRDRSAEGPLMQSSGTGFSHHDGVRRVRGNRVCERRSPMGVGVDVQVPSFSAVLVTEGFVGVSGSHRDRG